MFFLDFRRSDFRRSDPFPDPVFLILWGIWTTFFFLPLGPKIAVGVGGKIDGWVDGEAKRLGTHALSQEVVFWVIIITECLQ